MDFLSEYIQPLTQWLHHHPTFGLFVAFLISFSESLAVIGSIIPGSLTMTAIGILAGSGVMRIDMTLIAAILGAIAGDSGSYYLGLYYRERLTQMWPFSKYPTLLVYGHEFFHRHGSKSVLLGRFVGPLRSIIPVIAGMMQMSQWRFLIANTISGILWSFLYVGPGILIGTASSELSPEAATKLFLFILACLFLIWLGGIAIKKLIIYLNEVMSHKLHHYWKASLHRRYIARITPKNETNHYHTAGLITLSCVLLVLFSLITFIKLHPLIISEIDKPIYAFFQSFRNSTFDAIFVAISLALSPLSLLLLCFSIIMTCLYYRDWRLAGYFFSLIFITLSITLFINQTFDISRPLGLVRARIGASYPSIDLSFSSSLFCFLMALFSYTQATGYKWVRFILITLSITAGLSELYLGDNWLSDILAAYCLGTFIGLVHWLFFRAQPLHKNYKNLLIGVVISLSMSTVFANIIYFKLVYENHKPSVQQYVLTEEAWWGQTEPLLPLYCKNRLGHISCLFNIQYVGSLKHLKKALLKHGWKENKESILINLVKRFNSKHPFYGITWVTQLYRHKKPTLILYYPVKEGVFNLNISFWRSNYHLNGYHQPIWVGNIYFKSLDKRHNPFYLNQKEIFSTLQPAIHEFDTHMLYLQHPHTPKGVPPQILLMRESKE